MSKESGSRRSAMAKDTETSPQGPTDRLVRIVDHCLDAQKIADSMGDRFLSYMLAMVIQQARRNMRAHGLRN